MRRRKISSCITSVVLAGTVLMSSACMAGKGGEESGEALPEGSETEVTETEADPADISLAEVAPVPDQIYSGNAIYVTPVVTYEGRTLTEGVDYWLDNYTNNINVGTVTCDIIGNGETATGTQTITFNIITGDQLCDSEENAGIVDFVDRMYVYLLGRYPTLNEIIDNTTRLRSGSRSGIEMVNILVQSDEFANRNLSDEDFLGNFYLGVLNRNVDGGGLSYNLGLLEGGMTRLELINGIICSEEGEFANICNSLGIVLGNGHIVGETPELDDGIPSSVFNYSVDGRNVSIHRRVYQFIRDGEDGQRIFDLDAMCAASGYSRTSDEGFEYASGVCELELNGNAMSLTISDDEVSYYEDTIQDDEELYSVNGTDTTVSIGMIVMIEYSLENLDQ